MNDFINDYSQLSIHENQKLASKVVFCFDKYDEMRQRQLINIRELKNEIYLNKNFKNTNWKNNVSLPDIYELAQTLKSHLIENLYSNPENMFDVIGINPQAQSLANSHKAMLVNMFDRMNLKNEMEKLVDSIVESGEATLFVGWNTKYKKKRRPQTLEEQFLNPTNDGFVVEDVVTYDGPSVKCIDPVDFVFDIANIQNFESCAKIYRTYMDVNEIIDNKSNNMLNPQIIDELRQIANVKSLKTLGNLSSLKIVDGGYSTIYDSDLMKARARKGNKLEVLEFYGDIQKPDGTILKNYLVTVVARTKVVRFEPNPFVINPFIYASIIEDPETKRGVSPLKVAMILSSISSEILNKQLDALSLTINPPYLAPKGCFKGEQVVTPGKIIEYDSALMPQQPLPLDFTQAVRGWDFIRFFKAQIESATGIFKNMSGQLEQDVEKTATEFTYSVSSQAIRLNMLIDSISRKIIIPMIQAVAEITSNFKFGNETVVYSENGAVKFIDINDNVRCSYDFLYRYGDRKASIDRKSKFSQLFNLISSFAKIPDFTFKINWDKCFKYALEQFGVENTQAFINENVPANNTTLPSNQITNGSKQ